MAILTVVDRGMGIPASDRSTIFERFERGSAPSQSGGFGVGLWITKKVCHALGGTIALQSSVGQGTTFTVRLPQ